MTKDEFTAVMAVAASCDRRVPADDKNVLRAWYAIAGHIDAQVALDNIRRHYAEETRMLMPADLLGGKTTPTPESAPMPPVDPDDTIAYLTWTKSYAHALSLGQSVTQATATADALCGVERKELPRTRRPLQLTAFATPGA